MQPRLGGSCVRQPGGNGSRVEARDDGEHGAGKGASKEQAGRARRAQPTPRQPGAAQHPPRHPREGGDPCSRGMGRFTRHSTRRKWIPGQARDDGELGAGKGASKARAGRFPPDAAHSPSACSGAPPSPSSLRKQGSMQPRHGGSCGRQPGGNGSRVEARDDGELGATECVSKEAVGSRPTPSASPARSARRARRRCSPRIPRPGCRSR